MNFIYIIDNQLITTFSKSLFHRKKCFGKVGLYNNLLKTKKI